MLNFLKAQAYFIKKDTMFRGISLLFFIASAVLAFWVGGKNNFEIINLAQPLILLTQLSLFLYFVIPTYVCFLATEGYEYGSIKLVLASGQSRFAYITGKYISALNFIFVWVIQFFGVYYVCYMSAALISGSVIGNGGLKTDAIQVIRVLGLNVLYLSAYAVLIIMVGIFIRRTASAVVATFLVIFGDFLITGYCREASSALVRELSGYTLTTQIMKFSGVYVVNSERVILSGTKSVVEVLVIPLVIIAICMSITYFSFGRRDIHA
ncbi:ABC transporter permease [Paenibacillus sp. NPDC056722]|uniref:ABC transporter permease n=1 Tax=Paenibacillus sp. NPDC056722 TaxID=3345924 RepID=UPI003679D939